MGVALLCMWTQVAIRQIVDFVVAVAVLASMAWSLWGFGFVSHVVPASPVNFGQLVGRWHCWWLVAVHCLPVEFQQCSG